MTRREGKGRKIAPRLSPKRKMAIREALAIGETGNASEEYDPATSSACALFEMLLLPMVFPETKAALPQLCFNCDEPNTTTPRLYCSESCQQQAELVRYVRRKISAGGITRDILRDGIGAPFLMLTAGGYPERARRVPQTMRLLVVKRDGGRCRLCGDPGTDIDHISGDGNNLNNLRLLCSRCNGKAMASNVRSITPTSHPNEFRYIKSLQARLATRIAAATPLRKCDDEIAWKLVYYKYKKDKFELLFRDQRKDPLARSPRHLSAANIARRERHAEAKKEREYLKAIDRSESWFEDAVDADTDVLVHSRQGRARPRYWD